MEDLIAIIAHAERQMRIADNQQADNENDFEHGAACGRIEGTIDAYRDIIRVAAGRLIEAL